MTDAPPPAGPAPAHRPQRAHCPRCDRPLRGCLCRWVTPTANAVAVRLLQHPLEQHEAKGSARLLALSLQRCQRLVGERFDPAALAAWLGDGGAAGAPGSTDAAPPARCLLLYPAAPGEAAEPPLPLPDPGAWRLVLLDGTWRKTRKLLHLNPALDALPRWPLPAPAPPRYAIRRAQLPGQRSTLEAACGALAALEGRPDRYAPLLAAFDGWVAEQAARAGRPVATGTAHT